MSGFADFSYVTVSNTDPNTIATDGIYKNPGDAGAYFNVYGPTNEVFAYIAISSNADPSTQFTVTITGGSLSLNGMALGTSYSNSVGTAASTLNQLVFTPDPSVTSGAVVQISVANSGNIIGTTDSFYVYCFAQGTHIACPGGERLVEYLQAGDLVLNAKGAPRVVRFVGRRSLNLRRTPQHAPVRIPAGCLGDGLPRRDLRVSPDHAIAFDGILVPANALLGTVIRQEAVESVVYYHIQLDAHELVLAEGTPCETLLDADDPRGFDNADEAVMSDIFLSPCLPRMRQGPEVERIRKCVGLTSAAYSNALIGTRTGARILR